MNIFDALLVKPILNLLLVFYSILESVGVPGAFGLSIILLTGTVRFLLTPLTRVQMESVKKLSEIKPAIDALQKKHGSDKKRLQEEQMKLYKDAGINPAAGCLPALIQIPVFIALYNVFLQVLGTSSDNMVATVNGKLYPFLSSLQVTSVDLNFFGLDLAVKPNQWQTMGAGLLLIPVITAIFQWLQTKITLPKQAPSQDGEKKEDFSKALQTQTMFILPIMIGFFAYSFPAGLALYWNSFSIFGIIQQLQINKTKKSRRPN